MNEYYNIIEYQENDNEDELEEIKEYKYNSATDTWE